MNIVNFEKQHIEEAKAIALENYYVEKQVVEELPLMGAKIYRKVLYPLYP